MSGIRGSACAGFAALVLMLGATGASGADNSASGSLKIGEERVALKYAFAVMEADGVGASAKEKLTVFLSDLPVPDELRKASDDWVYWADKQARAGALHGLSVALDPATAAWHSGRVLTRKGLMFYSETVSSPELGDLRFAPAGPIGDQVAGKVSMKAPMSSVQDADGSWIVDAEFRATVIRRATVSGVLTGAAALNSPQYKAVLAFLEACRKKDLDAIRDSMDPQSRATLAEMIAGHKEETLSMFAEMAAETTALKLSKVTVRGDSAEVEFVGAQASEAKQSLRVALSNGEWKLAQ
jgi:hypothetical protein